MRCTKAELARRLGVSRQYIDKLISHGIVKIGSDKKIDVDEAMAAIEKYRDPTKEHVRKINQKKRAAKSKSRTRKTSRTQRLRLTPSI